MMADIKAASRIVKIGSMIFMGLRGGADEVWLDAKIEKALRAGREVTENRVTRSISWGIYADDMTDNLERHVLNTAGTKVQGTLVERRTEDGETTKTTLGKKFKSLGAAWGDNSDVPGKFE
jgi:hypothetical protein